MYLATIIFYGDDKKSRETIVVGEGEGLIQEKISAVKRILQKHNLTFVGSIVEEIQGVESKDINPLDFLSQDDKIKH